MLSKNTTRTWIHKEMIQLMSETAKGLYPEVVFDTDGNQILKESDPLLREI